MRTSINNNTTTLDDTVNNMKYSKGSKRSTQHDRSKYRVGLISALVLLSFVASVVTLQHHAGGGSMIHRSALMEHKAIMPQEEASQRSTRIPLSKLTTRQVSAMECPKNLVLIPIESYCARQLASTSPRFHTSFIKLPSLAVLFHLWQLQSKNGRHIYHIIHITFTTTLP